MRFCGANAFDSFITLFVALFSFSLLVALFERRVSACVIALDAHFFEVHLFKFYLFFGFAVHLFDIQNGFLCFRRNIFIAHQKSTVTQTVRSEKTRHLFRVVKKYTIEVSFHRFQIVTKYTWVLSRSNRYVMHEKRCKEAGMVRQEQDYEKLKENSYTFTTCIVDTNPVFHRV